MNTYAVIALLSAALLASGCSTGRSPVTAAPTSNRTGLGEGATLGLATVLGAAGGYAVKDDAAGAAIGAGAGLIAGAVVNNISQAARAQREAELMEAARREERLTIQQEYWEAERMQATSPGGTQTSASTAARPVRYQGGYFDGVNVAPREGSSESALQEPRRP